MLAMLGFPGDVPPRAVFPSSVGLSTLAVACPRLVLLIFHLTLCPFLLSLGPRCSASWPFWTRRNLSRFRIPAMACARLVLLVLSHWLSAGPRACRYGPDVHLCSWLVLLMTLHLALCALLFRQAQMLGIIAGMNQKDLSALLGLTVATCSCHFTEAWGVSRIFSVKVVLGP